MRVKISLNTKLYFVPRDNVCYKIRIQIVSYNLGAKTPQFVTIFFHLHEKFRSILELVHAYCLVQS